MASRYLLVGDPHGEAGDLDDLKKLLGLVGEVSRASDAPPLFLGDQYDTHAIVHAEVMLVWWEFLERMREAFPASSDPEAPRGRTIMLRGNHDAPANSKTDATALLVHEEQCRVVRAPCVMDGVLFVPYVKDPAEFLATCRRFGQTHTVVCHQAFDGSRYESGFPALNEAKPEDIPQEQVISGHIHAAAEFGKVWHPGAPRWRVEMDAKIEERYLWLVEFDDEGRLASRKPFPTGNTVRKIRRFVDCPMLPVAPGPLDAKDEVRVYVRGPKEYVAERAPLHEAAGALVRRLPDRDSAPEVRESDGVVEAWGRWVAGFKPPRGTSPERLAALVKERCGVQAAA